MLLLCGHYNVSGVGWCKIDVIALQTTFYGKNVGSSAKADTGPSCENLPAAPQSISAPPRRGLCKKRSTFFPLFLRNVSINLKKEPNYFSPFPKKHPYKTKINQ